MNKLRKWILKRKLNNLYERLGQVQLYLSYYNENEDKQILRNNLIEQIKNIEDKLN